MKTRIISGLIMAPLLVILVFKGYVLYAGCFVISLMGMYEFYRGFRELEIKPSYPIAVGSVICLYGLGIPLCTGIIEASPWITLWMFATVIACLLYLFKINERKLDDAMVTLTGIFYVGFFCFHMGMLGMNEKFGILVWLAVITAFGTDICAYFAGVTMGKHKLCPVISPKKTWEGAAGGVIGAMILSGLFGYFFEGEIMVHCMIIGFLGSIISMFGDLTASIFKRKMGIKDYGNLIPGHGGILDRFDSVLFTAPVVYYYVELILM
ncbi:MAG: phosphatidate cytidylyltransferase [Firmicutes bacterium]|nr:phosphatidate cytidylyltransferase [Bacillota bacterium]